MATAIDAVRIEVDYRVEFEGGGTLKFTLPPDHPLTMQILQYHDSQQLAAAKAEPMTGFDV